MLQSSPTEENRTRTNFEEIVKFIEYVVIEKEVQYERYPNLPHDIELPSAFGVDKLLLIHI